MTKESLTVSHLYVAMTTNETDETKTTDGNSMMASSAVGSDFYMRLAVVVIGAVGTVGNALILYALYASRQHKKHLLIVNQNVLDLFGSFFLCVTFTVHMFNIPLTGQHGHWLCVTFLSEIYIWWGTNGSMINLALITIDRYLMVVHSVRSKKWLRPWVIRSAMATVWFLAILYNTVLVFYSTNVVDGDCLSYVIPNDDAANMAAVLTYILFFYFTILIFRIQSNVIKTVILMSALYTPLRHCMDAVQYLLSACNSTVKLIPFQSFSDIRYYTVLLT